jgi:hypothetical protein
METNTTFKKATQVGIARTLNDARLAKSGFNKSSMVRGYATPKSGWVCTLKDDGNFEVTYAVKWGTYNATCTRGLTEEEKATAHENCTNIFRTTLNKYFNVLQAKGYNVVLTTEMVDNKISGFITVINNEVK